MKNVDSIFKKDYVIYTLNLDDMFPVMDKNKIKEQEKLARKNQKLEQFARKFDLINDSPIVIKDDHVKVIEFERDDVSPPLHKKEKEKKKLLDQQEKKEKSMQKKKEKEKSLLERKINEAKVDFSQVTYRIRKENGETSQQFAYRLEIIKNLQGDDITKDMISKIKRNEKFFGIK